MACHLGRVYELQPWGLVANPYPTHLCARGGFNFQLLEGSLSPVLCRGALAVHFKLCFPLHFLAGGLSQEAHCPRERERAEKKEAIDWRESRQAAFLDLCQGQGP